MQGCALHPLRAGATATATACIPWDGVLLVGVDLGRHVDPRHAWMLFDQLSKYSISMEIHPRMAWIYQTLGNCQRWGGVGVRGVSRMGPRHASGGLGRTPNPGLAVCAGLRTRASGCQAYTDVLAASPHSDTAPPNHGLHAVALAVASAGAGRSPAKNPTLVVGCATAPARTYPPPASRHGSTTRGSPDHPLRGPARTTR